MPDQAIRVEGLADLRRAFAVASKEMSRDLRTALEQAGEPIRQEASELAHTQISGMARAGLPWWRMRAGVAHGTVGYIAPEQRGNKRRTRFTPRRQAEAFKDQMLGKAMEPALEHNRDRVLREFDDALNEMGKAWARV